MTASAGTIGTTPRRRSSRRRRQALIGIVSIVPALALVLPITWYPLGVAVYHSFTKWNGIRSEWIGFDNYVRIFSSGEIFEFLRTNLVFFLSIPIILVLCMVVAVLLHEKVPGWRLFRSVYYIPTILSVVVVGFLARAIFLPDGVVNEVLRGIGLGDFAISWLETVPTALAVLLLAYFWQTLGQGSMIFLAGLSAMPPEVSEAAKLDGAGWWRRLFSIVLPLQRPAVSYLFVTNVIYVFIGLFALVYTVTGGGPGRGTTPIDFAIYQAAFQTGELGYAAALSVILMLIVGVIAWFNVMRLERGALD